MRKQRVIHCPIKTRSTLWEGANVIKLARELQEFLKTKMKKVNDPTFGPHWVCTVCDKSEKYECFGKTVEFCKKKGLNWNTFTEALNNFSGLPYDILCDADILNRLPIRPEENIPEEDVPSDEAN